MISAIINLKKEAGMTSHDAVFKLRNILREKKIGHGGTLDPDVTGVLPIAVGKATRLIEYMQESSKIYEGEITLGFSTTTEDAGGEVLEQTVLPVDLSEADIDREMATFLGDIIQIPPMYSAVKVNGRKLYEYARAGESVERPRRQVRIELFERTSPLTLTDGLARFSFRVVCSKGTYVRTLAVDLGAKLGIASHMSKLVRTASAGLSIENSLTLAELEARLSQGDTSFLLPIESAVSQMPRLDLSEEEKTELIHGRFLSLSSQEKRLAGFYQGRLLAIIEMREEGLYKPQKVFC